MFKVFCVNLFNLSDSSISSFIVFDTLLNSAPNTLGSYSISEECGL